MKGGAIGSIVLGVILILVTLILMPIILDANDDIVTHTSVANMTGLAAIAGIGPLVILLGLFASGGLFTFEGLRGRGSGTKGDIAKLVGSVVAVVVALILFAIIVTQTETLSVAVAAAEGNVTALDSIVSVVPMIIYVGIVVGAGAVHFKAHRRVRKTRYGRR